MAEENEHSKQYKKSPIKRVIKKEDKDRDKIAQTQESHDIGTETDFYQKSSDECFECFYEESDSSSDEKCPDKRHVVPNCESCGSALSEAQLSSRRLLSEPEESHCSSFGCSTSNENTISKPDDSESYVLPICDSCDLEIDESTSNECCVKESLRNMPQSTDEKKKKDKVKHRHMYI